MSHENRISSAYQYRVLPYYHAKSNTGSSAPSTTPVYLAVPKRTHRVQSPPTPPISEAQRLSREIEIRKRTGWLEVLEARKARLQAVQNDESITVPEPLFGLRRELMNKDAVGRDILRQIDLIDDGIERIIERRKMEEAAMALVQMSRTRACCACAQDIRNSRDSKPKR